METETPIVATFKPASHHPIIIDSEAMTGDEVLDNMDEVVSFYTDSQDGYIRDGIYQVQYALQHAIPVDEAGLEKWASVLFLMQRGVAKRIKDMKAVKAQIREKEAAERKARKQAEDLAKAEKKAKEEEEKAEKKAKEEEEKREKAAKKAKEDEERRMRKAAEDAAKAARAAEAAAKREKRLADDAAKAAKKRKMDEEKLEKMREKLAKKQKVGDVAVVDAIATPSEDVEDVMQTWGVVVGDDE